MPIPIPDEATAVDAEHNTTAKIANANSFFTLLYLSYLLNTALTLKVNQHTIKMQSRLAIASRVHTQILGG